jgi:hypothetical protein
VPLTANSAYSEGGTWVRGSTDNIFSQGRSLLFSRRGCRMRKGNVEFTIGRRRGMHDRLQEDKRLHTVWNATKEGYLSLDIYTFIT